MHSSRYLFVFLIFVRTSYTMDTIMLPFERFLYDLEQFIPTMQQEIEFAEFRGITDDQAFEQIKSLFPVLQYRLQELRLMGLLADDNRRKKKELVDKMCGRDHLYFYLKVDKQLKIMQKTLVSEKITAKNSLEMLQTMLAALNQWKDRSTAPCKTAESH